MAGGGEGGGKEEEEEVGGCERPTGDAGRMLMTKKVLK